MYTGIIFVTTLICPLIYSVVLTSSTVKDRLADAKHLS